MTDATFDVSPSGIYGMNNLAQFLNTMKTSGAISDWSPKRAESGSGGTRFVVQFHKESDAQQASQLWRDWRSESSPPALT